MIVLAPEPNADPVLDAASISKPVLQGRDILCFSHDWTGDPLSKTHLMRLLARKNRVLWVNSIGYRTPTINKARSRPHLEQADGLAAAAAGG